MCALAIRFRRSVSRGLVVFAVVALVLASCGDGEEPRTSETTRAPTTTGEPTTTTAEPTTTTGAVHTWTTGALGLQLGAPASDVIPLLEQAFGTADAVEDLEDGELILGYRVRSQYRRMEWREPAVTLVFTDYGDGSPDAPLQLVVWAVESPGIETPEGIAVGSTTDELRRAYPDVRFGVADPDFDPAQWVVGDDELALRGSVDWEWVRDLQAELNLRGAGLAVDGELGPQTQAALATFKAAAGLPADSEVDAATIDALGLAPPSDARVARMIEGEHAA